MKPTILLKIGAVIGLLFCLGHTSGYPWLPTDNEAAAIIAANIKAVHFSYGGQSRSLWDFYVGFGIIISVLLLLKSIFLWLTADAVKRQEKLAKPMMIALLLGYGINAFLSWKFFFLLPAIFALSISLLVLISLIRHTSINPQ